jgi:hypothetical protein
VKRPFLIAIGFSLTAFVSFAASVLFAFLTEWAIDKGEDNPAGGLILFGAALLYLALIGPVAASWFADVVERWGRTPKPSWLRLSRRLPFALTASGGIMYSGWMVMFRRPDLQPLWPFNVIVAAIGTVVAVYLAARIRPSPHETRAV